MDSDGSVNFAIITVSLNNRDGLERTINSVQRQTFGSWVQVIQDGASSDSTIHLLRTLDEHFSWESTPDGGIYDAMNRAMARAEGGLVWFLNAGDTLASSDVLERVAASYRHHGWRWAIGGMNWERRSGEAAYRPPSIPKPWRVHWGLDIIPHPASVLEATFLKELGSYSREVRVAADQDFLLRALERSAPALLQFPLSDFEPAGGSTRMTASEVDADLSDLRRIRGAQLLGQEWLDRPASRAVSTARCLKRIVRDSR